MKSFLGHAVARIAVKCYHVIQEFLGKQKLQGPPTLNGFFEFDISGT